MYPHLGPVNICGIAFHPFYDLSPLGCFTSQGATFQTHHGDLVSSGRYFSLLPSCRCIIGIGCDIYSDVLGFPKIWKPLELQYQKQTNKTRQKYPNKELAARLWFHKVTRFSQVQKANRFFMLHL